MLNAARLKSAMAAIAFMSLGGAPMRWRRLVLGLAAAAMMAAAVLGCSDGGNLRPTPPPFTPAAAVPTAAPTPTATPAGGGGPAGAAGSGLGADDLGWLPDDPAELMYAMLTEPLDAVGRKMAYSHNPAFIPVILEFLRFQTSDEAQLTLVSYISRIVDKVPPDDVAVFPPERQEWGWWVKWLAERPEVQPPAGFDGWKGQLFSYIDRPMGEFLYDGVPTTIRLEEIVWGGVRRDGIPDLRFPAALPAAEADYLNPDDRVFGVSINGQQRAYPLRVLNAHEMANDTLGGVQFALAY